MKVGITYDLQSDYANENFSSEQLAELDKPETVNAIAEALAIQGFVVEKIGHIKRLTEALVRGHRWHLIFNISEGVHGVGRESAVPCLLDAYQVPYTFSDPVVLSVCLHKGYTKQIVRQLGVPTADFAIANSLDDLKNVHLPYPLFVKPVAEGTGKGISEKSVVSDAKELEKAVSDILTQFGQPALIETFLSGREFTVGMVGTGNDARVIGVMEIHFGKEAAGNIYSYKNKSEYENKMHYSLLEDAALSSRIEEICLKSWRGLNCRDGGRIDIRCDAKGDPMFIEVNPLAGLHPQDSDLIILSRMKNIAYDSLIKMIVESALKRAKR
jgi:D-alanine-D-alanine ligase